MNPMEILGKKRAEKVERGSEINLELEQRRAFAPMRKAFDGIKDHVQIKFNGMEGGICTLAQQRQTGRIGDSSVSVTTADMRIIWSARVLCADDPIEDIREHLVVGEGIRTIDVGSVIFLRTVVHENASDSYKVWTRPTDWVDDFYTTIAEVEHLEDS